MSEPYLEITYRHGLPVAAYYYLPGRANERSHRTRQATTGMLVDYAPLLAA